MGENKRFDCFENKWCSRTITDNGECIGAETAVDLLNSLNDENEQLKQQLKTKVIVNKQYEELQKLKQENEQLKEENIELKHDNKRLVKFIMSKGIYLKDYLDWLKEEVWND